MRSVVPPLVPCGESQEVAAPASIKWFGFPCRVFLLPLTDTHYAQVVSAVEVAHEPGQPDLGPEYHISVSLRGTTVDRGPERIGPERIDSAGARDVLGRFGLDGWTEDNHVARGNVRNFWRPVAEPLVGWICRCVDDEPAMREDKGDFIWRGVTR